MDNLICPECNGPVGYYICANYMAYHLSCLGCKREWEIDKIDMRTMRCPRCIDPKRERNTANLHYPGRISDDAKAAVAEVSRAFAAIVPASPMPQYESFLCADCGLVWLSDEYRRLNGILIIEDAIARGKP